MRLRFSHSTDELVHFQLAAAGYNRALNAQITEICYKKAKLQMAAKKKKGHGCCTHTFEACISYYSHCQSQWKKLALG